jgi:hypothetical protein
MIAMANASLLQLTPKQQSAIPTLALQAARRAVSAASVSDVQRSWSKCRLAGHFLPRALRPLLGAGEYRREASVTFRCVPNRSW